MELSPLEYDLMELRTVARPSEDEQETRRGGGPERADGTNRGDGPRAAEGRSRADGARGAAGRSRRDEPRRADGGAAVAGGPNPWAETATQQPNTTSRTEAGPPADGDQSSVRPGEYRGEVPDHLRSTERPATGGRDSSQHDAAPQGRAGHGGGRSHDQRNLPYAALTGAAARERPYLRSLPGGATTELLVFQWLEGLVERAGIEGARDALEYYEAIEWVTEEAATNLQAYLGGLPEPTADPPGLTTQDHRTSLEFLVHIAGQNRD